MVVIEGLQLDERYSWIEARNKAGLKGRTARGVIFLVSIQNVERRWQAWQKMVKALNPVPEKVIFGENDSIDRTVELVNVWDFPHELISFKSKKNETKRNPYSVIARNRQHLLERARQINSRFAIFIDDDVFPDDVNLIEKLTKHNLPIVGGTYLRPFEDKGVFVASKWHVETSLKELPPALDLEAFVKQAKNEGRGYLMFSSCEPKLYRVGVTSAGCLCLKKELIQDKRINFFPIGDDLGAEGEISEDFGFCLQAKQYGYEIYLDGATRLAHLKPSPDRIRPWVV